MSCAAPVPTLPPRVYVGLDCSTTYTGVALVREAEIALLAVRVADVERASAAVAGAVESFAGRREEVVVGWEVPPPASREKRSQAPIGLAIGRMAGWTLGRLAERVEHLVVHDVQVRDWRATMQADALERFGLRLDKPSRRQVGKLDDSRAIGAVQRVDASLHVRWRCGHTTVVASLGDLPVDGCSACSSRPTDVSEVWKRHAFEWASRVAPTQVEDLVGHARARARSEPAPHRLAGVADACEALAIAHHLRGLP